MRDGRMGVFSGPAGSSYRAYSTIRSCVRGRVGVRLCMYAFVQSLLSHPLDPASAFI